MPPVLRARPEQTAAGGVSAHGDLTGLDADDHAQYLLADGSRPADELEVEGDITQTDDDAKVVLGRTAEIDQPTNGTARLRWARWVVSRASSSELALSVQADADAWERWSATANGELRWGDGSSFPDAAVLGRNTAGLLQATGGFTAPLRINAQTGTTYTLALGDAGQLVTLTNADPITLTVPTNASVAFPVGTVITIVQGGAGTVEVEGAGGVTVNATGLTLAEQWSAASLVKIATDTWLLIGDVA